MFPLNISLHPALSQGEVLSVAGLGDVYIPLVSQGNIYDEEPVNSKKVNFLDVAELAETWMELMLWP